MSDQLLDNDLINELEIHLAEGEVGIWQGHPNAYFSLAMVDMFYRNTGVSFTSLVQVLVAIFTFRTVKYIFLGKLHAIFLLLPALFWLVALLPDFYKNFRKNKTRYQLTNQRVIIETWSWWSAKI